MDFSNWKLSKILIIVSLVIVSNFVVYYTVTKNYEDKITGLSTKIDQLDTKLSSEIVKTNNTLLQALESEKLKNKEQISGIENKLEDTSKSLENKFISENIKIKTDLDTIKKDTQSNIDQVSNQLGSLSRKNSELEDKLSEIQVSSSDFSSIVEEVVKSVVTIKTNLGQGSGVIFDDEGYIMTNKHVIDGISSISVIDYNSEIYSVTLIGTANNADLAVLKINSNKKFNSLEFADSNDVKVGTKVIAIGNPLGLSFSVTEGIVSAINRNIDNSGIGYVQTDVSINAGNSGGPLVDANKKIVGINTFKLSNTEGLGFAIPSNIAKSIGDQALAL